VGHELVEDPEGDRGSGPAEGGADGLEDGGGREVRHVPAVQPRK
jgi:hypothetical protein